MDYLQLAFGIATILLTSADIFFTVLFPQGAGPLTTVLTRALSYIPRTLQGRWESTARRMLGGTSLITIVVCWIAILWWGWWIIFGADPNGIVNSSEETAADSWERLYFTGYMFFTLGLGDYVPENNFWRVVTTLGSSCGLFFMTLSITYLMPVLGAAIEKYQLSDLIANLGSTPEEILLLHWDGEGFERLVSRIDNVIWPQLQLHSQRHLAYPILHQFLDRDSSRSLAVRLSALNEALTILEVAVPAPAKPQRSVMTTLFRAVDDYLAILESEFTTLEADCPPEPSLMRLRESQIPVLWTADRYTSQLAQRRAKLRAFVQDSGGEWDHVTGHWTLYPPGSPPKSQEYMCDVSYSLQYQGHARKGVTQMPVDKKVAFLTGGSSGIGRAAAIRLAANGWRVAVSGRTESELVAVREEIEEQGNDALAVVADLQDEKALRDGITRVVQKWGRLDTVFANGGINGTWTDLENLSIDDWDKTLSINLRGTFLTVKLAYPHLKKTGGSVIVTSSVNGTRMFSNQGATAYAVSKAGQVAMVKMLAIELARHKVRINAVCPGAIDTEIEDNTEREMPKGERMRVEFPEGKIPLTGTRKGRPQQIADLVHFLASEKSSHITGSVIHIDGAQSLLQG